jgi:hypothetical protein
MNCGHRLNCSGRSPEPEPDVAVHTAHNAGGEVEQQVRTAPPSSPIEYILSFITKSFDLRSHGMSAQWDETFLLDEVSMAFFPRSIAVI